MPVVSPLETFPPPQIAARKCPKTPRPLPEIPINSPRPDPAPPPERITAPLLADPGPGGNPGRRAGDVAAWGRTAPAGWRPAPSAPRPRRLHQVAQARQVGD